MLFGYLIETFFLVVTARSIPHRQPRRHPHTAGQHRHGRGIVVAVALPKVEQEDIHHVPLRRWLLHLQRIGNSAQVRFQGQGPVVRCLSPSHQLLSQFRHPLRQWRQLQVPIQHPVRVCLSRCPQCLLVDRGHGREDGVLSRPPHRFQRGQVLPIS